MHPGREEKVDLTLPLQGEEEREILSGKKCGVESGRADIFHLILTANRNYQQFDNSPLSNRTPSDNDVLNGRYGFGRDVALLIDIVGYRATLKQCHTVITPIIIYLPE